MQQLLVKRKSGWEPPAFRIHAKEQSFQHLVQSVFPQVLASQFDRPSITAREVQTPEGGRADVVSVDQDGIITLCECKLDKNAGSRREVLGQVLEYGASFAGMSFNEFATRVADRLDTDFVGAMTAAATEDFVADEWESAVQE